MIFKKLLNNKVKEIAEQRKVLTETFPYTDWKKVPYTQYDKFLSLKDLIGECGVVWTNAFGRSNTEAEDTRKYLKDYSKHYEYVQDFNSFSLCPDAVTSVKTESKISVTNNASSASQESVGFWVKSSYVNNTFSIKVSQLSSYAVLIYYTPDWSSLVKAIELHEGIVEIPTLSEEELARMGVCALNLPQGGSVTIEQIPNEVANERDIELFNFGYSRQSGFNGYVQDFRVWSKTDSSATVNQSEDTIEISGNSGGWVVALWNVNTNNTYVNKVWTIDLHIVESESNYISLLFFDNNSSQYKSIQLNEGRNVIQPLTAEEYAKTNFVRINCAAGSHVVLTQVPEYRGAIVGDGVDDYGQCVKDFALPDDYTVVAIREGIMNNANSALLSKSRTNEQGAFIFNYAGSHAYSYGMYNQIPVTPLFSYQTKTSCNGTALTVGSGTDTEADKLYLFKIRESASACISAALYSFGIFNRTLTAEELALVEDCMYLELEYNTNILDGIEYYDILDARYRSNEEAEDKRNKWNGRLGKLHMTLHNYGYSQMSGWDGTSGDFSHFTKNSDGTLVSRSQSKVTFKWGSDAWCGMIPYSYFPKGKFSVRVSFSNPNIQSALFIYYNTESSVSIINVSLISGINAIDKTLSSEPNYVYVSSGEAQPGDEITIELIPDYGGALVSDGVDDYAVSDEVIDEEIGGVVMLAEKISDPATSYGNIFSSSVGLGGSTGKEIAGLVSKGSDSIIMGDPWTSFGKNEDAAYGLDRSPIAPNNKLMVGNNNSNEWGNAALYQLRLIKNQPTDLQLEVIKHQILMEHNDYIKEMGWE